MKENQWLSLTKYIWNDILLSIDDLKHLHYCKRVCQLFNEILSNLSFVLRWNLIHLKNSEIPKCKNNYELFDAIDYKSKLFREMDFVIKPAKKPILHESKWSSHTPEDARIIHSWQPFYSINKFDGTNQHRVHLVFEKELHVKTIIGDPGTFLRSDISDYLFYISGSKNKNRFKITAFSMKKKQSTLYYIINNWKSDVEAKHKDETFSVLMRNNWETDFQFYQFEFKDFCKQGKRSKFKPKILNVKTASIITPQISTRSILYQKTNSTMGYLSFDSNFSTFGSEEMLHVKQDPVFVYNEKEEFLLDDEIVINCKTGEIKKLSFIMPRLKTLKINKDQFIFMNEMGNIIAIRDSCIVCINVSNWDKLEKSKDIALSWKLDSTIFLVHPRLPDINSRKSFVFCDDRIISFEKLSETKTKIAYVMEKTKINYLKDFENPFVLNSALFSFDNASISSYLAVKSTMLVKGTEKTKFFYLDFSSSKKQ